jgi:hypothetical protein
METSNDLKLVLNSGSFTNENGETYVGYGFTAYRTDPLREIYSIRDLSVDADEIRELIRLILDNDVSVTHFQDLIEDFLEK